MEKVKIQSYEDLIVYQKLLDLTLDIHHLSLSFPKHEHYEIGSQIRRSSYSIGANLAEGWNNKHLNLYLEGINRALAELRETRHHLTIAYRKGYFEKKVYENYVSRYNEIGRMLYSLEQALLKRKRGSEPNS